MTQSTKKREKDAERERWRGKKGKKQLKWMREKTQKERDGAVMCVVSALLLAVCEVV